MEIRSNLRTFKFRSNSQILLSKSYLKYAEQNELKKGKVKLWYNENINWWGEFDLQRKHSIEATKVNYESSKA